MLPLPLALFFPSEDSMNYTVKTTIPVQSATAITVTGNSNSFPLPNGEGVVEVLIAVSAVSGTSPSLTPKLQVSMDGTNWYDAVTGSAMTAVSNQRLACQSLAAYGRISYTVSGTTPSLTTAITVLAN